jgi:hypothetical protein
MIRYTVQTALIDTDLRPSKREKKRKRKEKTGARPMPDINNAELSTSSVEGAHQT